VVDVISLDESMRGLIPSSCCAFIVLFPVSDIRRAREDRVLSTLEPDDERVIFTKQQTQNACGTVAVVHAVCNNTDVIELREGSMLRKFCLDAKSASVEERSRLLAESKGLETAHDKAAKKSETTEENQRSDLHFLALVCRNGRLFELDGRNTGPIDHGACAPSEFVNRSCVVMAELMAMSSALQFSSMALVRGRNDDGTNLDSAVQQLMEMGVCESRDHALAVLASCNNDVEAALRSLLGD
jgi:ubiquitin carboxyl-terminal hydrolase L3